MILAALYLAVGYLVFIFTGFIAARLLEDLIRWIIDFLSKLQK